VDLSHLLELQPLLRGQVPEEVPADLPVDLVPGILEVPPEDLHRPRRPERSAVVAASWRITAWVMRSAMCCSSMKSWVTRVSWLRADRLRTMSAPTTVSRRTETTEPMTRMR
jgi:hypothetical protein